MGSKETEALDRATSFGRPLKGMGGGHKGEDSYPGAQKGGGWEGGREMGERFLSREQVADRSVGIRGVGPLGTSTGKGV